MKDARYPQPMKTGETAGLRWAFTRGPLWEQTSEEGWVKMMGDNAYVGYVSVSQEHPLYGADYDVEQLWEVKVHGGLTFAGPRLWEGAKEGGWWFGFDTVHAGDEKGVSPAYVEEQCQSLAEQLAELKGADKPRAEHAL